ncbi:E3 ubiquitin-protein ligase XIAP-like isoform X2 [Babylonia areolata]
MDGNFEALQLKPFVTIDEGGPKPDVPKEDQAIRPYMTPQSDMFGGEVSHTLEAIGDFGGIGSHADKRERENGQSCEENLANNRDKSCKYDIVVFRGDWVFFCVVVFDGRVFYPKTDSSESADEHIYQKAVDAEAQQRLNHLKEDIHQIQKMFSDISQQRLEEDIQEMFDMRSDRNVYNVYTKHLVTDLPNKWSKGVLKVSGKWQRRKKLGVFDTFHYVNPPPQSVIVYPVNRQNITQGQGSDEQAPQQTPRPPQARRPWPPPAADSIFDSPWTTFSQELHRMGTFVNQPQHMTVFALILARAGFMCLPDGAIVCYFCGVQRNEWNFSESAVEVHRQLNPNCSILTGVNCNNVPVLRLDLDQVQAVMEVWSLSGPPLIGSGGEAAVQQAPSVLGGNASAGAPQSAVYQLPGPGEQGPRQDVVADGRTTSGSTGGSSQANQNDQRQLDPRRDVRILDGTAQPEEASSSAPRSETGGGNRTGSGQQAVTYQQLGIITDFPKRAEMATLSSRLATFSNWPSTYAQNPLALAEAGFYYAGYADCGRCFQCGGGLKNWVASDSPWVEHARWFPNCSHLKQSHGQDFIDVVTQLNADGDRPQISMQQVKEEMRRRLAGGDPIPEPAVDPAITTALVMGFNQADVETAVQRLQSAGHALTADKLMDYLAADGAVAAEGGEYLEETENAEEELEKLLQENSEIRQQRQCKICLDKEVCMTFLPCGHLVCCSECAPALRNCPMCRQRIKGRSCRVYDKVVSIGTVIAYTQVHQHRCEAYVDMYVCVERCWGWWTDNHCC